MLMRRSAASGQILGKGALSALIDELNPAGSPEKHCVVSDDFSVNFAPAILYRSAGQKTRCLISGQNWGGLTPDVLGALLDIRANFTQ
jgi:hypothetical protein